MSNLKTAPHESPASIPVSASRSLASNQSEDVVRTPSMTNNEPNEDTDGTQLNDPQLARTLSQRKSHASGHYGEEWAQIEKLISRMFGHERKANSEEEKSRHAGVVWRNLTVKGVGLGAALQPTTGDIFLGLPRLIERFLTRGRKGTGAENPEVRTIVDDFTVRDIYIWKLY